MGGESFSELVRINGAGNSAFENHYEFRDQKPFPITFYRISQVDWDGTRSYGATIMVENESNLASYSILENPVNSSKLRIQVNMIDVEKMIQIELFTMQGKSVLENNYKLTKGESIIELNTLGFLPGVYIVNIKDNYTQFSDKIIIQSYK